jgi:hypothetical protein
MMIAYYDTDPCLDLKFKIALDVVEWFVNVLFIYFILYFIVTHKFHNF